MALVPEAVWLGATAGHRYDSIKSHADNLSVEAAAAAISLNEHGLALKWLEEGRSILWNQILQLRTPFDGMHDFDLSLAQELKQVARELDQACSKTSINQPLLLSEPSLERASQH
jgi:hypothetical protein